MNFDRKDLSNDQLIKLYHELVRPRIIEEKMLVLLRQGKLAKWFSGIGQEAVLMQQFRKAIQLHATAAEYAYGAAVLRYVVLAGSRDTARIANDLQ